MSKIEPKSCKESSTPSVTPSSKPVVSSAPLGVRLFVRGLRAMIVLGLSSVLNSLRWLCISRGRNLPKHDGEQTWKSLSPGSYQQASKSLSSTAPFRARPLFSSADGCGRQKGCALNSTQKDRFINSLIDLGFTAVYRLADKLDPTVQKPNEVRVVLYDDGATDVVLGGDFDGDDVTIKFDRTGRILPRCKD